MQNRYADGKEWEWMDNPKQIKTMSKLVRYPNKGYIGGVCHGLGEHTKIDPILWRILAFFGGFGLIYLVLWVILKKED